MLRKSADDLVLRLEKSHDEIENLIQDYMNEYADYGWDNIATELTSVAASIDCIKLELKYAKVKADSAKEERVPW